MSTKCCLDNDCSIIIDDRKVVKQAFDLVIKRLDRSIFVWDIGNTIHHISEYAMIEICVTSQLKNDFTIISHVVKFSMKIHIVNDLKTNILINMNVMRFQKMKLDAKNNTLIIDACKDFVVFIDIVTKLVSNIKRIVRSRKKMTISTHFIVLIPIIYYEDLSNDRDMLFESQCLIELSIDDEIMTYIVDSSLSKILVRNTNNISIQLSRRERLDTIVNYNQDECYIITLDVDFLVTRDWINRHNQRSWKDKLVKSMTIATTTYAISLFSITNINASLFIFLAIHHSQIDSKMKYVLSIDLTTNLWWRLCDFTNRRNDKCFFSNLNWSKYHCRCVEVEMNVYNYQDEHEDIQASSRLFFESTRSRSRWRNLWQTTSTR